MIDFMILYLIFGGVGFTLAAMEEPALRGTSWLLLIGYLALFAFLWGPVVIAKALRRVD